MGTDVSLGASLLTSGGVLVSGFMIRKRVSDQVPCKADFAGMYMYWRVQNDLSACMRFVILNEMGVMVWNSVSDLRRGMEEEDLKEKGNGIEISCMKRRG